MLEMVFSPLRSGTKRPQQVIAPFRLNWPRASSI